MDHTTETQIIELLQGEDLPGVDAHLTQRVDHRAGLAQHDGVLGDHQHVRPLLHHQVDLDEQAGPQEPLRFPSQVDNVFIDAFVTREGHPITRALLALIVTLFLVTFALPTLNSLTGKEIRIDYFSNIPLLVGTAFMLLFVGIAGKKRE